MNPNLNLNAVAEIAKALPGKWEAVAFPHEYEGRFHASLVRDDGLSLFVTEGGYGNEGRVIFRYDRPKSKKGETPLVYVNNANGIGSLKLDDPSIKASSDKTPAKLVNDIKNRLLAAAEIVHAEAIKRIAKNNAYYDNQDALTAAMELAFGRKIHGNIISIGGFSESSKGYGDVTVCSGKVDIKLSSLSADLAAKIAQLLSAESF